MTKGDAEKKVVTGGGAVAATTAAARSKAAATVAKTARPLICFNPHQKFPKG